MKVVGETLSENGNVLLIEFSYNPKYVKNVRWKAK